MQVEMQGNEVVVAGSGESALTGPIQVKEEVYDGYSRSSSRCETETFEGCRAFSESFFSISNNEISSVLW